MVYLVGSAPVPLGSDSNHVAVPSESYDGATLNLIGRVALDRGEPVPTKSPKKPQSSYTINCKNNTIISSLNTRTLFPSSRFEEMTNNAISQGIDILAIQEHRFYHPDQETKSTPKDSYQLITSSAWKNAQNATIGGVGVLLSSRASNNLLSVESINPRILVIEFEGNPKTTIICVYSPHNACSTDEIEDFYTALKETLEQIPLHNFVVIAGDLNAKLGPQDVPFSYNPSTNRNGEYLKELLDEFNLFSANNHFMKPKGQLWTFEYPSGERAQLDYLIFRKKWRNSITDSRAFSSFSSVGSDHRIVSAHVKISLRKSKSAKTHPMKSVDWREVSSNQDISDQFSIDVYNRFQALAPSTEEVTSENINLVYDNLVKTTQEVALETLPKKQHNRQNKPSNSKRVLEARVAVKTISQKYHSRPTQALKIQLITAKKNLDDAYLDAEVEYINGKVESLEHQHISQQHHLAWKTVKEIAGKNPQTNIRIKGGSTKNRMENWKNHFKCLLGRKATLPDAYSLPKERISDTLDIDTSPFTLMELITVTKQLKSCKAFGPDNIPALLWKNPIFHNLLLNLCNNTFSALKSPKVWHKSQIIPLPKKGDLSLATNYRGISLMPIAAKIYNRLILNRLVTFVEPLL